MSDISLCWHKAIAVVTINPRGVSRGETPKNLYAGRQKASVVPKINPYILYLSTPLPHPKHRSPLLDNW